MKFIMLISATCATIVQLTGYWTDSRSRSRSSSRPGALTAADSNLWSCTVVWPVAGHCCSSSHWFQRKTVFLTRQAGVCLLPLINYNKAKATKQLQIILQN